MRWLIGFAHGSGADVRFNSDGIGAACLVHLVKQIGQGFRIAFRSIRLGGSIRRQCFCRDDPWRNGGEEILGEKRSQWLIFPGLDITCGPVVEQAKRSEERRGGEECGSTFRFRWWPNH